MEPFDSNDDITVVKLAFYYGDTYHCRKCDKFCPNAGQIRACPHCGFDGDEIKPHTDA